MKCYLFDTNIWSDWYKEDNDIIMRMDQLEKDDRVILSSVVWGEAVYGANVQSGNKSFDFNKYSQLIEKNSFSIICGIDKHTADIYGKLRAKLFDKYAPKGKRKSGLRPEELRCPTNSKELGIQENDLWLLAQAIAYNYIFVTRDKKIAPIKLVLPSEFKCEKW